MELPVLSTPGDCGICKKPLPWNVVDCIQQYCCGAVACNLCHERHIERQKALMAKSRARNFKLKCAICKGLYWAQPTEEAVMQSDTDALKKLAKEGNAYAQMNLGFRFRDGDVGVPKCARMASALFEKSVAQGNARAAVMLADMLLGFDPDKTGDVPIDEARGIALMSRAAEGGDAIAMHNMGVFHAAGMHGCSDDMSIAGKYWKGAADLGHEDAMFRLGAMHKVGERHAESAGCGVGHSELEAFKLYKASAEKGNVSAMCSLGQMYLFETHTGFDTAKRSVVKYDFAEGVKWLERAAGLDALDDAPGAMIKWMKEGELDGGASNEAMYTLYKAYMEEGPPSYEKMRPGRVIDPERAKNWLSFAAIRGHKEAQERSAAKRKQLKEFEQGIYSELQKQYAKEGKLEDLPPPEKLMSYFQKKAMEEGHFDHLDRKVQASQGARHCSVCNATKSEGGGALGKCAGCGMVAYCCKEHQKAHWKAQHKKECAELKTIAMTKKMSLRRDQ